MYPLGIYPTGIAPAGKFTTLLPMILTPTSRGSITINSIPLNVFAPPIIDSKAFTSRFDFLGMREAIKTAFTFFSVPAWDKYIIGPTPALAAAMESDDALDEYIRTAGIVTEHVVGTASMTAEDTSYGVVNPDLLVKGVAGLRIVDASVLPLVTAGHTQGPVYIAAERASWLIKEKWASD
ncbi:glucose-methanol-choline oxidoreductase [Gymnopus androsaceus JB14]|uniref:Glucose-methanol-choline oxidoreductase n=1 Tax=Gymnopus androsaceus JB14 TaxID=1447944 RepID=A0A6A4HRM8_9AGAR|nr:glucose-methanol-choline oxidoreductase [Gymnopus androsaceus JB14]